MICSGQSATWAIGTALAGEVTAARLRVPGSSLGFRGVRYDSCKRAGLRQIGWHVLSHTFASHLAMRGAAIKVVQELLGHTDIMTTMRYAHLSPETRRDAVVLLDVSA